MNKQITMWDISNYLSKVNSSTSLEDWKKVTIEFRDKFGLTEMEAIGIMSGRIDSIIKVLERKKTSLAVTR